MKKVGLLCLALVLALGTLGIGYATWSANVTILQTVETGSVRVGVLDVGTNDSGEAHIDPGYTKHVARCESTNTGSTVPCGDCGGGPYYDEVTEVITNAYPCYSCNITYKFVSCGSIPVHFAEWKTTIDEASSNMCDWVELKGWWLTDQNGQETDGTTEQELEDSLELLQLHQCDNITLIIQKHLKQELDDGSVCPENGACIMTHEARWVQFNKSASDE